MTAYASAAVLTLNGVDYDPVKFTKTADDGWNPTFQADVTLARRDLVAPTLTARTNLITNPAASVDLTDAVAGSATLVRQASIQAFPTAHRTAFRLNSTGTASQVTIGGDYGAMRLGMQPGKTYTASGTFYVDTALSGTENPQSRQIAVGVVSPSNNAGSPYYLATSPKAPNTAGVPTRVSVTFTIPADATSAVLRFFAGHATGTAYWTDLMLIEGNGTEPDGTVIPFFDGDSQSTALYTYAWTGTAGKTSSTKTVAFVSTSSTPIVDPRENPYPVARLRYWFGTPGAPELIFDVRLLVRNYVIDDVEDTVTLTLLSHEILLQDYKNADVSDFAPGAMLLRDMYVFAMRKIGVTAYDLSGVPVVTIPATATVWRIGQSLDDWLRSALRSQGIEIFYDAARFYRFDSYLLSNTSKFSAAGATGQINALWGVNLLESRRGINVDNDDYADAAVVTYSWTDAAGASQHKSYASTPAGPFRKVKVLNLNSADPGFNPADSVRVVARLKGGTQEVTMLPSPSYGFVPPAITTPWILLLGMTVNVQRRDGSLVVALISSIRISYPDDQMTLSLLNPIERGVTAAPALPLPLP